jgi:hypothetical protein
VDPIEGSGFPEVREMVQGVTGVHEIRGLPRVPVGQESGPHELDICDATVSELAVKPIFHNG